MNNNWNKEINMSEHDKYNLHDYRITKLEEQSMELKTDIQYVKEILTKIDKRMSLLPENGLFLEKNLVDLTTRLEKAEDKLDKVNIKLIKWTAIFGAISVIISQIAIPFLIAWL